MTPNTEAAVRSVSASSVVAARVRDGLQQLEQCHRHRCDGGEKNGPVEDLAGELIEPSGDLGLNQQDAVPPFRKEGHPSKFSCR
jgi:hypothetical protein